MQTTISKSAKKYLDIIESGSIEESQIISLRALIKKPKNRAERDAILKALQGKELLLELSQNRKGLEFLLKCWKTDTGKVRKNNPFSEYEIDILNDFSHFTLAGLKNVSHNEWAFYLPVYRCYAKEGNYFEYYYNGEVVIKY